MSIGHCGQILGGGTTESRAGQGFGIFAAAGDIMGNPDLGQFALESCQGDGILGAAKDLLGNVLTRLGFNADTILGVPGPNQDILDTRACFRVRVKIRDNDATVDRKKRLGRLQGLLPFGNHRQGIGKGNGIKATAGILVDEFLGQDLLDIGRVNVETDPTNLVALGFGKGPFGIFLANLQEFGTDIQDNDAFKEIQLGPQIMDIASSTTADIQPRVSLLDRSKTRHHFGSSHEHVFAHGIVSLGLSGIKGRHFVPVRIDFARRQGMQNHLGGRLDFSDKTGPLTGRQFFIDKGKGILGHVGGKGSGISLDAVLGIPLRTQIGNIEAIEKGLVVHFGKGRSPQNHGAGDRGALEGDPFFMNDIVGHPIHVIQEDQFGKGMRFDAFHGFLDGRMMPFKATGILAQGIKVLLFQGAGTAGLVLVALFVIKSVKVIVTAKFGIQKDFPQNAFVKLGGIKLGANLIGRHAGKGGQNAGEQASEPNGTLLNDMVILANVGMGKAGFGPFLNVEADHVHEPGNEVLNGKTGRSGRGKALAKDAFNAAIPPFAAAARHGMAHAFPHLHGDRHVGTPPNGPPLVVGQVRIAEHANLEFKEPQLMLVHVADDNLGGSFNGIVQDNVASRTNAKNDIVLVDFENLVIDGRVFPTNVVDVGPIANRINHVEGRLDEFANAVQDRQTAHTPRHGRIQSQQGWVQRQ